METNPVPLLKKTIRISATALFGGMFYSVWLAVFLLAIPRFPHLEVYLWLIAPFITALGFWVGMISFDPTARTSRSALLKTYGWPMLGCLLGAVSVYWYGPMLIVFSMLALGTLSVVLREVFLARH